MPKEWFILSALEAFIKGDFQRAFMDICRCELSGPMESSQRRYLHLAAMQVLRAHLYHRQLYIREGLFLFDEVPVREAQRRHGAIISYFVNIVRKEPLKSSPKINLRLVTPDDKAKR